MRQYVPHPDCRATAGLSLKEIGDHLGHRSTSATSTYAKVNMAALREVGAFDLGDLQ
jgi:integrase/recombinase XerD